MLITIRVVHKSSTMTINWNVSAYSHDKLICSTPDSFMLNGITKHSYALLQKLINLKLPQFESIELFSAVTTQKDASIYALFISAGTWQCQLCPFNIEGFKFRCMRTQCFR